MSDITIFVKEALTAGRSRDDVRRVLAEAGWPADEIEDGLRRYAEIDFPIPVPRRIHSGSARDAFLYLVTYAALYASSIALGALTFGIVDHYFPDPVYAQYQGGYESEGLRWNIATLIVAFPLYLGLTRMHLRSYATDPERRTSAVRRWLTYLTLFVAATVILGTLIALVGGVLGGELAVRFLLKTGTVLALSGAVFVYYLWEMKTADRGVAQ
jgi:hypothetical protein